MKAPTPADQRIGIAPLCGVDAGRARRDDHLFDLRCHLPSLPTTTCQFKVGALMAHEPSSRDSRLLGMTNTLTEQVLASWRHDWEDRGSPWHYCADHWMALHGTTPACAECGADLSPTATEGADDVR